MAKIKIEMHNDVVQAFLKSDKMYNHLKDIADKVQKEAAATASNAEDGAGGKIDGYAAAGFEVFRHLGGTRVEAWIVSKADPYISWKAYWHTQKRDGVAHMRKALYKFTKRGS
jgi:hypothetical protein